MAYEADMVIVYDAVKKTTAVVFRGQPAFLPGPYQTRKEGIAAGEEHCRKLGWRDI